MQTANQALHRLFALCTRIECNQAQLQQIEQAAAQIIDWDIVPSQAEVHGIAPLLYHHLTNTDFALPLTTKRELYTLVVRHRLANQTRAHVLCEILLACRSANIPVLVLKGAALAHWLYPKPGLRPMHDLDLLVHQSDAARAQSLLNDLGFTALLPKTAHDFEHRHLPEARKNVDGFAIAVELHHHLFEKGSAPLLMSIDDLYSTPISFALDDLVAQTLGYEDMLWHLCQHLIESTNVFCSVRLIWVADIINLAEQFATKIDWEQVQIRYPLVPATLSLLHWLTPLSADLLARAAMVIGHAPQGMWNDFRKLPRTSPEQQIQRGLAQTLHDAFSPSEWWLRLHFGLGSAYPLHWHHYVQHTLYLAHRLGHVLQRHARQD